MDVKYCTPCDKTFSGSVPYKQHIESTKHIKKVSSLGLSNTENLQELNIATKPVNTYNPLMCSACNISFDSAIHFQSHCYTLKHADKVRSNLLSTANNIDAELVSSSTLASNIFKDTQIPSADETDSIFPMNQNFKISPMYYAECKVCEKKFSGSEPYQQHMASAVHKKKLENQQLISGQKMQCFTCKPCNMVFTGLIPYKQHEESERHKKKLLSQFSETGLDNAKECNGVPSNSNIKVMNCMENVMDQTRPWFCKICLIECTGILPFKQHLSGMTHIKKSRMVAPLVVNNDKISQSNNGSTPYSEYEISSDQEMQTDLLLPKGLEFSVISAADMNVKEFYPDVKINFDSIYDDKVKDKNEIDVCIKSEYTLFEVDKVISLECDNEINIKECT